MARSDIGGSGVMFSIDTESGFDKAVLINAAWGLGENVVQGAVNPDEYMVYKPFLGRPGCVPIIEKARGQGEEDDLCRRRPDDEERPHVEEGTRELRPRRP
jgi:pyruvate, water dikinase